MTDEQWAELAPYAEAYLRAKSALSAMMAQNMPTESRARIEAQLEYEKVSARHFAVYKEYLAAKLRILGDDGNLAP